MEQYQPHNNNIIDPSLTAPQFFSTTTTTPSASSSVPTELPPVVNFSPAQPALPNQTSYDGMIVAAISALREKDGSSRQAIARYIERVYNNLPSNHSVLLTNHLKKLKNSGQISMVKHSYMLPSGSANNPSTSPSPLYTNNPSYSFSPSPVMSLPPPQLFTNTITTTTTSTESAPPNQFLAQQFVAPFSTTEGVATSGVSSPPPSQPKRRGRPPKAKPDLPPAQNYGPGQAQFQSNGPDQTHFQNYAASNGLDQVQNYIGGPIGSVSVSDGPGELSAKRKPGRPRKERPTEAQYTLATEAQQVSLPPSGAPMQPPAEAQNNPNASIADQVAGAQFVVQGNGAVSGSEAMLVSLGLSDDPSPAKMRPRRSPKPTIVEVPQAANGGKKRPGRPRKANPGAPGVYPVQVPVGTSPPVSSPGRGRPRKYAVAPGAVSNGVVNGGVNGIQIQPKKRGRKPKSVTQAAAFAVPVSFMLPEQMNAGGPVMMPQGTFGQAGGDAVSGGVVPGQVHMAGGYNGVVYPAMKRGRGRPPRTDGGLGPGLGPRKARKLSGKPLGRPRKNHANSEDQSFEIVYLKTKLSYLQSKIKEAVPVIKAYLNGEEANAMGALGQLEELSTEDFGAALKAQNQQQPPAQHLQAEQQ